MSRNFGISRRGPPHLTIVPPVGDQALDRAVRESCGEIWDDQPGEHTEPDDDPDRGAIVAGYAVAAIGGAIMGGLIVFFVMSAAS